jgi:hypothetical protein
MVLRLWLLLLLIMMFGVGRLFVIVLANGEVVEAALCWFAWVSR